MKCAINTYDLQLSVESMPVRHANETGVPYHNQPCNHVVRCNCISPYRGIDAIASASVGHVNTQCVAVKNPLCERSPDMVKLCADVQSWYSEISNHLRKAQMVVNSHTVP